jgi:hypothetical protein
MRDLEIDCETFEHLNLQAITDNFLPEVSVCVGLRSLEIHARVKDATSEDLVLVLQGCKQLQTLRLEKGTEDLVDETVVRAIWDHPSIEDLSLKKQLDQSITSCITSIPQPLRNITFFRLATDAAAAKLAISRLEHSQTLYLTASSEPSVFPHLSGIKNLRSF